MADFPSPTSAYGIWKVMDIRDAVMGVNWPQFPGAPTIGTASVGSSTGAISVAFTAPTNVGSSAITSYTATSSPGGITGSGASSPVSVTGLTVGTSYTFTVTATNSQGTGLPSAASNSVVPVQLDQYFNYVTMLLPANGTNGAQNNTFLDSSSNAFTITRNGNTTQGTFSPYGANWSNYFDGSGDSVSAPNNSTLALSSGDFAVEWWMFPLDDGTSSGRVIVSQETTGGMFWYILSGTLNVRIYSVSTPITYALTDYIGKWTHIAVTRESGTLRLFVNGALVSSASNVYTYAQAGTYVGGSPAQALWFYGYISNFRVVKGNAVYTSAFTPSTVPLGATSGGTNPPTGTQTALLTCQSNRFIDNSSNAFTITGNGNTSVQRFSPFSPSSSYSTSTIGGSGYFDGTTDWLSVPNNTAFDMGSGDFTIEGWFYQTGNGYLQEVIAKYEAGYQASFSVELDATTLGAYVFYGSTSYLTVYAGTPPKLNTWNHFALQRNGSYNEFYLNGARLAQVAAQTMRTTTSAVRIGDLGAGYTGYGFQGHISDIRVRKGTATYSGTTYTVPTAPLTAVSNTVLLCNMTNAALIDNAEMNDFETVGSVQISTAQSKFGGSSVYLPGVGNYLVSPASPSNALGTGDFTVEAWVYPSGNQTRFGNIVSGVGAWYLSFEASNYLFFSDPNTVYVQSSSPITINTWTYVAVTRSGTTLKMFFNGVQVGSATNSTNFGSTPLQARLGYNGASHYFVGYLNDVRVTKGYARTITTPTEAFPTR